jgi:hypothetical protein
MGTNKTRHQGSTGGQGKMFVFTAVRKAGRQGAGSWRAGPAAGGSRSCLCPSQLAVVVTASLAAARAPPPRAFDGNTPGWAWASFLFFSCWSLQGVPFEFRSLFESKSDAEYAQRIRTRDIASAACLGFRSNPSWQLGFRSNGRGRWSGQIRASRRIWTL